MNYILYGTSACHLCEEADVIINPIQQEFGFMLQRIDIAESDALISQYGIKIPVFYCEKTAQSLEWPFDESKLIHFINAQ
jgi:hypothetical protein